MDRRRFLKDSGLLASSLAVARAVHPWHFSGRLLAAEGEQGDENPNWADPLLFKASAKASSHIVDPPWQYVPALALYDAGVAASRTSMVGTAFDQYQILHVGWATETETAGAWLEISFPESRAVRELWVFGRPLPYNLVGQEPFLHYQRRDYVPSMPRKVSFSLLGGSTYPAELRQAGYYQIVRLPREEITRSIRINIQEVWPESGTRGTGLGKVKIFPRAHASTFEVIAYPNYDVRDGKAVQAATIQIINPGEEIPSARLQILRGATILATIPLEPVPSQAVINQDIWIPASFEDAVMEFKVSTPGDDFKITRTLRVPAYESYFDRGIFGLHCSNACDLGWLDIPEKFADIRSEVAILPAMKLLKENPEFRYSLENTAYLMEFLERHPEKRDEMAQYMREGRFTWGATYTQVSEVTVGPEMLVRQFYLGRRWLKKTFPGADTRWYIKHDPCLLTLQMPQILVKAGVKYLIQGRFPFGYYFWEAPDGSRIFTFGGHYFEYWRMLDFTTNQGWLSYAAVRENYYSSRKLPPVICYNYTSDFLPPQPGLIPYVRQQNDAMERFAERWNEHYASNPERQIHPPQLTFVEPEGFLDELTKKDLNIETLRGDWPFSWAYYDEPGHREALLAGRQGHNRLLAVERFHSALTCYGGFGSYPEETLAEAWQANCWPDHGWGGIGGPSQTRSLKDRIRSPKSWRTSY